MRLYTVHLKDSPGGPAGAAGQPIAAEPAPPSFELVRDGFCWPAFFLPFVWAIWRGQWTGLLLYAICILAISTLTVMAEPGEPVEIALGLGLALVVGFTANDWRRWRLQHGGYRAFGAVAAADADEAALRVLAALEAESDRKSGRQLPAEQADPHLNGNWGDTGGRP